MTKDVQKRPYYVLVMDDNPAHAELMTEVLDRHFAPVIIHTVDTIKAGVEFMSQTSYDLILTDSIVGGDTLLSQLKEIKKRYKDIPVIVVTGRGDESLAAQLIRRGATEYLVKARETLDTLAHVIERYLKK